MKKLKLIVSYIRLITCLLLHRNFGKSAYILNKYITFDLKKSYLLVKCRQNFIECEKKLS